MLIDVLHQTVYRYDRPATYSIQRLHMTPLSFEGQRVVDWRIEVPGAEVALQYEDAFGNLVHQVTLTESHIEVAFTARGRVEREDRAGLVKGLPPNVPDRLFLRRTPATAPDARMEAIADPLRGRGGLDLLHTLMGEVRDRVDYRKGTTGAHTTAAEALTAGSGVCQDHAHVFIALARLLGVPARYVTGYMLVAGDDPADAAHAWAEAFVDGLGWVGFDPANLVCPTERYVRVACGLDAGGVTPVRGSRRGGGDEHMAVEVVVEPAAQQ